MMLQSTKVIEGVIVPLLTPADGQERVDEPEMRALIRHCIEGGADALFTGGTGGLGALATVPFGPQVPAGFTNSVGSQGGGSNTTINNMTVNANSTLNTDPMSIRKLAEQLQDEIIEVGRHRN